MIISRRQLFGIGCGALSSIYMASRASTSANQANHADLDSLDRGGQRIVLISDLNSSYGSTSYIKQVYNGLNILTSLKPDLVICAGDMIAGQSLGLSAIQLQNMWSAFDKKILYKILSNNTAFSPCIGNHDASSSRGVNGYVYELDRQQAKSFWQKRQNSLGLIFIDGANFPFRYSIKQAETFAVFLDASSASISESDWTWAEEQLSSASARQAKLRLLIGHLPPYGIAKGRDRAGEVLNQPSRLINLLNRHNVHLYISGHHHAWYPGEVGTTNLLSLGAMGSGPRELLGNDGATRQTITVLDLPSQESELIETTFDLNKLNVIKTDSLPSSIQSSLGEKLKRREGRINLSIKPEKQV